MANRIRTLLINSDPFPVKADCFFTDKPELPCRWITCAKADPESPSVTNFRLVFQMDHQETIAVHVTADQQYLLWLDGTLVGRGCEMKSPENWFFESYELILDRGEHRLEALVWNYGNLSPDNRMSLAPGFILIPFAPYTALLGTGVASWKTKIDPGFTFQPVRKDLGVYISVPPCEVRDCRVSFCEDDPKQWADAVVAAPGINGSLRKDPTVHCLVPSPIEKLFCDDAQSGEVVFVTDKSDSTGYIPAEKVNEDELKWWNAAINKKDVVVPAGTVKRVVFRLDNYYCGYARLKLRGGRGARIRVTWAETAFTHPDNATKSDRRNVAGRYLRGVWDEFILDGNDREIMSLAWRSGKFLDLQVTVADEDVLLEQFTIQETRYPLEPLGEFLCDQNEINEIVPLCVRTLQASAHDNFVDCPYYEQLPYTGDGRLQALVNLAAFSDDTLVRKMLVIFAESRDLNGFTMAAWPRKVRSVIPSFSLSWIGMVHDYALWRDDLGLIVSLMPGVRFLLDNLMAGMDSDGFLRGVDTAWNFIDWADDWHQKECFHVPPGMDESINATYNWLFVYTLGLAKKLEDYVGDPFLSARWDNAATVLASKLQARFWDSGRGLFREDDSGRSFSEHTQVLAILSGYLEAPGLERLKSSLFSEKELAVCSIYYRHYFFEACRILNRPDAILSGLELWNSFLSKGFHTAPETPENKTFNQRSDCHGWGSHPFYHLIASLAGIRPAKMGFKKVLIAPLMGDLAKIDAKCFHPAGMIHVKLSKHGDRLQCHVSLPPPLQGELRYGDSLVELPSGEQSFTIEQHH